MSKCFVLAYIFMAGQNRLPTKNVLFHNLGPPDQPGINKALFSSADLASWVYLSIFTLIYFYFIHGNVMYDKCP